MRRLKWDAPVVANAAKAAVAKSLAAKEKAPDA